MSDGSARQPSQHRSRSHLSHVTHYHRHSRSHWFARLVHEHLCLCGSLNLTHSAGAPVTRVLLSKAYYPSKISKVIILTRDTTSANAKALTALGAEAVQASDDSISAKHLEGVDVFVNTLSGRAPAETTKRYADAAAAAKVKVYFPSEFGVYVSSVLLDQQVHSDILHFVN